QATARRDSWSRARPLVLGSRGGVGGSDGVGDAGGRVLCPRGAVGAVRTTAIAAGTGGGTLHDVSCAACGRIVRARHGVSGAVTIVGTGGQSSLHASALGRPWSGGARRSQSSDPRSLDGLSRTRRVRVAGRSSVWGGRGCRPGRGAGRVPRRTTAPSGL